MKEKNLSRLRTMLLSLAAAALCLTTASGQRLSGFRTEPADEDLPLIKRNIQFNGYTNYWHDTYSEWYRYGHLFKAAVPDLRSTVLQSKIDVAEDLGLPGLLMQEGFLSRLLATPCRTLDHPGEEALERALESGHVLVVTSPETALGRQLEEKAAGWFDWSGRLGSHQWNDPGLQPLKAFYLVNGATCLFVLSSASPEAPERFRTLLASTRDLLDRYRLYKGFFGAASLLKSVTCAAGHPLEVMGTGMNEGCSWFVFDGYMDFLAKRELESWVEEVNLPVVAEVGFSPVYGCADYEGLQVQDMATKQAWIDFARKKGGYVFRPVYDPESDQYEYDGVFATEGNKDQINNENKPFVNKTGFLSGHLLSSMIVFIEKEKALTSQTLWEAILDRREVAVLPGALALGAAAWRHAVQLLYLDRIYLEDYFNDRLDLKAGTEGYDLVVTVRNLSPSPVSGELGLTLPSRLRAGDLPDAVTLQGYEEKQFRIPLQPGREAMGRTNPIAVSFVSGEKEKRTLTMLDLPPAISAHQLRYAHAPEIDFPVTVHNFSPKDRFPVEVLVYKTGDLKKPVLRQTQTCQTATATFREMNFRLKLPPGAYLVRTKALDTEAETQLGVGKAEGRPYAYEIDLNSDGVNEYRLENDSVQVTLLRTGARVIEYIVKSRNENVFFKIWPEKTPNHRAPFRTRGFYPYGGFEDFLGQASMETHRVYDAKILRSEGDYVRVEMETDYYGNRLKKIFTLYGNTPLLEIQWALAFRNPEANVIGPQPILELGKSHGTEDVFTVPATGGPKEYRMRPETMYGQAIEVAEGWNAGHDTQEDIAFIGAFPVAQPLFLHMWMNLPANGEAPHTYVEFQPWTPIAPKTVMYFSYYIWGNSGHWMNGLEELRKRNLITRKN
ncbi:MAG: hypothetical protein LBP98_04755 [Tannerella sp.]|nr:hypothetical protein [Tannerella sp.]